MNWVPSGLSSKEAKGQEDRISLSPSLQTQQYIHYSSINKQGLHVLEMCDDASTGTRACLLSRSDQRVRVPFDSICSAPTLKSEG